MISTNDYNDAVKRFSQNLYRFVFKSLKDKEAANDLVQDAFLKLWQNREKVEPEKIKPWLFSVAHHAMINYLKLEARKTPLEHADAVASMAITHTPDYDIREIIEKGLQTLLPRDRSIVLLRDLEGYSYQEIGEILQLNESQVKVYLFRARKKIKDSIKFLSVVL